MVDLTNQKFGRWLVISEAPRKNGKRMWNCVCECGTHRVVRGTSLTSKGTLSCGCYTKEVVSKIAGKHYGQGTRLYAVWDSMRQRCYNSNNSAYYNYGGRGIKVCKEWDDFAVFREWALLNGYDEKAKKNECTLDRINVNLSYSPDNCRWVSAKIQGINKRNTVYVTYKGITLSLSEWAEKLNIKYPTLWRRYKYYHMTGDKLFRPVA